MNRADAYDLARRHLVSIGKDAGVALAINDAITEEHEAGYVFFYNTEQYWRTRDMMDGLAGNGPILVRQDGTVADLPTNKSVEQGLASLSEPVGR